MKNNSLLSERNRIACALCALAIGFSFAASAQAEPLPDNIEVKAQLSAQYIDEDERDLSDGRDNSLSEQAQVSAKAKVSDTFTAFTTIRALNIDGSAGFDNDTGETISNEQSFIEAREFWLRWEKFFDNVPLYLQVGRQRLREPRSLWWNDDFDLARLGYDSTLFNGFIGIGENQTSYRLGNEDDFLQSEEDRFRMLGEASWQYRYNHFLEARVLSENDHSSLEAPGRIIDANDRDNEDLSAFWAGLRAAGELAAPAPALDAFRYRGDVIGLWGDVDTLTSAAGPGLNRRTVTGAMNEDLSAWAFDGMLTFDTAFPFQPVLVAGYAYGSGDSNPGNGTDRNFRQSDLHGANSLYGLGRASHKNYGEVLRPELSNLHILTAGADFPVTPATDIGVTYFNYHLADDASGMRSAGITAPLTGTDEDIGQAVDLVLNVDVDDQFGAKPPYTNDVGFRFIVGSFFPGDAYGVNEDESAYRVFTELKLRF